MANAIRELSLRPQRSLRGDGNIKSDCKALDDRNVTGA
eukprot:CAMPEP_0115745740 /NCGR_PEP_ID=MMETSP0272-20121206/92275_1 /TAXON_ID=71861 /ORGANISM="Scrippsiella trochoidea, Strain CCMP3099" /LENGTH=37 /DNA_ID= /DNA_START= /DNA_END= /DNA_ORIENTATION=